MPINCKEYSIVRGPVEKGSAEYRRWSVCRFIVACEQCGEERLFGYEEDTDVPKLALSWFKKHQLPDPVLLVDTTWEKDVFDNQVEVKGLDLRNRRAKNG
ncbi:MAG: hypothetical protein NWE76_01950 [Candidatus Bathyarchaeota archaeon]|nr:hypothetical protein [Candidatus Bathyarchaeota archaeon]